MQGVEGEDCVEGGMFELLREEVKGGTIDAHPSRGLPTIVENFLTHWRREYNMEIAQRCENTANYEGASRLSREVSHGICKLHYPYSIARLLIVDLRPKYQKVH